jgi:hypothetical protein
LCVQYAVGMKGLRGDVLVSTCNVLNLTGPMLVQLLPRSVKRANGTGIGQKWTELGQNLDINWQHLIQRKGDERVTEIQRRVTEIDRRLTYMDRNGSKGDRTSQKAAPIWLAVRT